MEDDSIPRPKRRRKKDDEDEAEHDISSETTYSPQPLSDRKDSKAAFIAQFSQVSTRTESSTSFHPHRARPRVLGLHHFKFGVSNLDVSIAWYERVLGAQRIPSLDHVRDDGVRFAAVLRMPDWANVLLELRHSERQARKDRGWDPITLSVARRSDLLIWVEWLDRWGTTHSPLLTGMRGWLLIFEDPDGRRIRIYTKEEHGGREPASTNDTWLNEP